MDTTPLDKAKYVRFTTYRRNGTPVHTPVWIVPFEGGYAFTTDATSGKAKRLRNDPTVEVAVSDMRGRVADGATTFPGTGRVVLGADAERVHKAVARKYWLFGRLLALADTARVTVLRRARAERAAVAFSVVEL
jgi:PPOX class probable F420-dependent enzyme